MTQRASFREPQVKALIIALAFSAPVVIFLFHLYLPAGVDWYDGTGLAIRTPLDPYSVNSFHYPPWFALLLSPLGLLPSQLGQAINAYLNLTTAFLIVVTRRGKPWALAVVGTSLPLATLLLNANVEWVPMLAFLIPSNWGLPLLAAKPQSGGLVALLWFKQAPHKLRLLIPGIAVGLGSLLIWGWWLPQALGGRSLTAEANASPWPWLIPLGLILMYFTWAKNDELLAVGATLCLTPYFVIHSTILFFSLLAARLPYVAATISLTIWILAIIQNWHLLLS